MELKVVTTETHEGVTVVTLNRPERLNAWTTRMETELRWCMRAADADGDVRVVVVTGAGRAFCAGADMGALEGYAGGAPYDLTSATEDEGSFAYLLDLSKPVIAAINGAAAGVGFVLACFADLRFAAAGAKITTSFARLGLPAEHGVSWVLPRIVGVGRAADLLYSSRVVLAEEALAIGLVNRVAPADALMSETLDYARVLAKEMAPSSLRAIKRQLWAEESLATAWRDADARMVTMVASPEFAEGVAAFTEKRPPKFPS
ncbi:MAG: enoyl-CoA hydratase-related protein [Acidimicrobiales bacterium]